MTNASATQFKQLLDFDQFFKRRMLLSPDLANLTRSFVPPNSSQTAEKLVLKRVLINPKRRIDVGSPPTAQSGAGPEAGGQGR